MENLKGKVVSGLFWKFAERILAQGVSFIISLVLARLLSPQHYGTVALVVVFINIANVFVSNGLGEALIRKKDADDKDFSTMFYCSVVFAIVLYLILYVSAPGIALFYENVELTNLVRVLALQIPLSAVKTIQHSYVSKKMIFKKFFFSTFGGTVVSGIIGIAMAYKGLGVWAIIAQYLINSVIDMIILFITVPWRPKFIFDFVTAIELLRYGWKLTAASLLNVIYGELRSLLIGKVYSEADLGLYSKGNQFPSLIINNINDSISTVLFPALSTANNEEERLKSMTRRAMQVSAFVIFPMMIGMIAVADNMISVLLTDKWLECVPYLRLCCIFWMFQPIQTANIQALKAIGRSDICLKLEIVKKIIGFALLILSVRFGVFAIVMSNTLLGFISMVLNIEPNRRIIKYGYWEQFKDVSPAFLHSMIMGVLIYFVGMLPYNKVILLILQVIAGICFYIISTWLGKVEGQEYVQNIVKAIRKR